MEKPSQSSEKPPTNQLQNGNARVRQQVFVLTPDVLKRLGIADKIKVFQANSKASNGFQATSEVKLDNVVKKLLVEKVPKPPANLVQSLNSPNVVNTMLLNSQNSTIPSNSVEKTKEDDKNSSVSTIVAHENRRRCRPTPKILKRHLDKKTVVGETQEELENVITTNIPSQSARKVIQDSLTAVSSTSQQEESADIRISIPHIDDEEHEQGQSGYNPPKAQELCEPEGNIIDCSAEVIKTPSPINSTPSDIHLQNHNYCRKKDSSSSKNLLEDKEKIPDAICGEDTDIVEEICKEECTNVEEETNDNFSIEPPLPDPQPPEPQIETQSQPVSDSTTLESLSELPSQDNIPTEKDSPSQSLSEDKEEILDLIFGIETDGVKPLTERVNDDVQQIINDNITTESPSSDSKATKLQARSESKSTSLESPSKIQRSSDISNNEDPSPLKSLLKDIEEPFDPIFGEVTDVAEKSNERDPIFGEVADAAEELTEKENTNIDSPTNENIFMKSSTLDPEPIKSRESPPIRCRQNNIITYRNQKSQSSKNLPKGKEEILDPIVRELTDVMEQPKEGGNTNVNAIISIESSTSDIKSTKKSQKRKKLTPRRESTLLESPSKIQHENDICENENPPSLENLLNDNEEVLYPILGKQDDEIGQSSKRENNNVSLTTKKNSPIDSPSPDLVHGKKKHVTRALRNSAKNLEPLEQKPHDTKIPVMKNNVDKKVSSINRKKNGNDSTIKEKSSLSRRQSGAKEPVEATSQRLTRSSRGMSKAKILEDCITYGLPNRRQSTKTKKDNVIPKKKSQSRKNSNESLPLSPQTTSVTNRNDIEKLLEALEDDFEAMKESSSSEASQEIQNSQDSKDVADSSLIKRNQKDQDSVHEKQETSPIMKQSIVCDSPMPSELEKVPLVAEPQSTIITEDTPPASQNEPQSTITAENHLPAFSIPCNEPQSPIYVMDTPAVSSSSSVPYDEPPCTIPERDTPPVSPPSSVPHDELPSITVEKESPRIPASSPVPQNEPQLTIPIEDTPPASLPSPIPQNLEDNQVRSKKDNETSLPENHQTVETPISLPVCQTPTPRRRGRPRKVATVERLLASQTTAPIQAPITPVANIPENETTTSGRVTRVPRKPDEVDGKGLSDGSNDDEEEEEEQVRKNPRGRRGRRGGRGRGRGRTVVHVDEDYVPRMSTDSKKSRKEDEMSEDKSPDGEVKCGKCNEQLRRNQWPNHNLSKHNNMGWREGDPVPDYENDDKLWKNVLTIARKRKRGILVCDKCSTIKRSVIGFISHYQFCGKTDEEREAMKWICPLCRGVFMPSSQEVHERMHREAALKNETIVTQVMAGASELDGKGKRKAAEKAATKISEFTKLVKDTDEPPAKKIKIKAAAKIKDLIEHPQKTKSIPNVWKGAWMKALAVNKKAVCRQLGCTFETSTLEEIYKHHGLCNFTPETAYICRICKYHSESLTELEDHVKKEHSERLAMDEDSDFKASEPSDESEEEVPDDPLRTPRRLHAPYERLSKYEDRANFLKKEPRLRETQMNMTYVPALRWTMEFEKKNYRLLLFDDLKPNTLELLTNAEAEDYLPELKASMRTKRVNASDKLNAKGHEKSEWKIWKQFESSVDNEIPTFFVGGPVWAMAWLPIPALKYSDNVNQYVAISTHRTMEGTYAVGKYYKFNNLIQIWNLGKLDHNLSSVPSTPRLAYAVAHDKGTIWSMEWCPSGTYEDSDLIKNQKIEELSGRMGLLATASSDGCIHIYSLPFPDELQFTKTDNIDLPIYKTNPVMSLHVNVLFQEQREHNWQCIKLSWTKLLGHDIIVGGLSNGYVTLWDIASKSPLLVTKIGDTLHLNSIQHFYAHGQAVTYVEMIPLNGKRYLATASLDRCIKYWDLENINNPMKIIKKGAVINGALLTHWPNILTTFDDIFGLGHTVTYMMGLREPSNKTFPMLPTNSTTYSLAVSDYANGICHGTLAGEIAAIFPFQLLYLKDLDKLSKRRWLLSSIEVVDLETTSKPTDRTEKKKKEVKEATEAQSNVKEYVYQPETYEKCKDRFGIVFRDNLDNFKNKNADRRHPVSSETMMFTSVEQYHFASVNRIAWNPNPWSYLWITAGYQNGLIRMFNFKSMSMQNSVMKFLPEHTQNMMEQEGKVSTPIVT